MIERAGYRAGVRKSRRMSEPSVENKPRNYRNGYSKKTLKTQLGAVNVRGPGIETENTSRRLSAKYSRNADGMEEKILGLYVCGMSQRDVSE